jgi:hypothetical protein
MPEATSSMPERMARRALHLARFRCEAPPARDSFILHTGDEPADAEGFGVGNTITR